jgi:hypothetical protein
LKDLITFEIKQLQLKESKLFFRKRAKTKRNTLDRRKSHYNYGIGSEGEEIHLERIS